jgi:iron complex outermembrane recepter protein
VFPSLELFRTLRRRLAVTVVLGAFTMGWPVAVRAQQRHLHGTLTQAGANTPIDDAEVSVVWAIGRGQQQRRTRSDAAGQFDFRDLPAQPVLLRVRRLGFRPVERTVDLTRDDVVLTLSLTEAPVQLAGVTIQADTVVEALERVAAVSTLDREALNATRGQTLGETLKHLPGVSVIQLGPSIAKPVIRGLNSQRVLVMNGGLRQEDQQWGTEHAPNLDSFDADAITVVRGAATVLYGPDALGGVVRVDHAMVADTGRARSELAFNTFTNSRQGALSFSVQGGGLTLPGVGRTGYRVRVSSRLAGNAATPDYFLSNTGFRELNGSATFGVQRAWGTSELALSHFGTELGVLRQAHAGNFDDLQRAMSTAPRDSAFSYDIGRPNQRVSHTAARWRTTLETASRGEFDLVYGLQFNDRREYDNHGPLRFRNTPAFHLRLFTNSLDARWKHPAWRGLTGTVGTTVMQQGNQTIGKAFLIPGFDLYQGAVFGQEEWSRDRLTVTAGARGDVFQQTTIAFADAGIRSPAGTKSWSGFAGSVGASWRFSDAWQSSVRVARAWRPPTVNERYAQGVHHGSAQYELGQADLRAERSLGVEAGLRYVGTTRSLDVAVYDNTVRDFIFLQPRDPVVTLRGTFPAFNYAQTRARLRGVEVAARWSPVERLELQATGTMVRGTNRATAQPLFDMPADRALLQARVNGRRAALGAWHLGLGSVLVRRQDGVPEGTIYTLPTAGYALLQIEAGMTAARLFRQPIDVSLSVTNALDTRYRDYLSRYRLFVNDPGRDVVMRVRVPIGS